MKQYGLTIREEQSKHINENTGHQEWNIDFTGVDAFGAILIQSYNKRERNEYDSI